MKFRPCVLFDIMGDKVKYGLEVLGQRGKWYGVCSTAVMVVFDLKYDACAFALMLNEIAKPKLAKNNKSAKRRPRRKPGGIK